MEWKGSADDIAKFQKLSGKNMQTVKSWLRKGLVPGARLKDGKWVFSKLAMPPYTAGRPRKENATSIRKAIIKAALRHQSTCAKLFDLSDVVFDSYVQDLKERGLIQVCTDPLFPGDKFILTTLKTDEYLHERGVFGKEGLLNTIASKALEAVVSALIKNSFEATE